MNNSEQDFWWIGFIAPSECDSCYLENCDDCSVYNRYVPLDDYDPKYDAEEKPEKTEETEEINMTKDGYWAGIYDRPDECMHCYSNSCGTCRVYIDYTEEWEAYCRNNIQTAPTPKENQEYRECELTQLINNEGTTITNVKTG